MKKGGFTILELLVFSAIFSIVAITFIAILLSVTRVQLRETASAEVNQQSQFIMQTLQRYIEESSLIETPPNKPTSTLVLRIRGGNNGTTTIYLDPETGGGTGRIYVVPPEGIPEPISSNRVVVSDLTFTKKSHPNAHDTVDVNLELRFKSSNPQKQFEQILQTSIARVSAATFDSDLMPATGTLLKIGGENKWESINNAIYFNGDNLGIFQPTPGNKIIINNQGGSGVFLGAGTFYLQSPFQVEDNFIIKQSSGGKFRFKDSGSDPGCTISGDRGKIWFTNTNLKICIDPGGSLGWYDLYNPAP